MKHCAMLLLFWLGCAPMAKATDAVVLPRPESAVVYRDRDPAALYYAAPPGRNAQFRRNLNAHIRANPRNAAALIQRAFLHHASGDIEEGDRDFIRVIEITADDPLLRRRALWSLGWSAFNRDEPRQAMAFWQQAADTYDGRPGWLPYSMAVAAWTAGDEALALDWYDAAVRSDPQWRQAEGVESRTLRWKPREREVVQWVFKAWSMRPAEPASAPAG